MWYQPFNIATQLLPPLILSFKHELLNDCICTLYHLTYVQRNVADHVMYSIIGLAVISMYRLIVNDFQDQRCINS